MESDSTPHSESQTPAKSGFAQIYESILPILPLEIWVIIANFCRVHDDDRYRFGQICPFHKPTLHSLSLTCHALRSLSEPLLLESVELRCRKGMGGPEDIKQGGQLLQYLDDRPEKRSLVKYIILENWPAWLKPVPNSKSLSQMMDDFTDLRGIFMSSVAMDNETYTKLFEFPRLEFIELRDIGLGQGIVISELIPESLRLKSLKIAHPRLETVILGRLARSPSLENLEYTTRRFHVLEIGPVLQHSHIFYKLKSFRTNEPVYMAEWYRLAVFLRRTPNLQSIHLEPHLVEIPRKEGNPLPADMLPSLRQFSGNITSAGVFVDGRPVAKITLLPSRGNPAAITRSSLISLTTTSIPLRVLCIYEVHIVPDILRHIATLLPWLEELEWHITDPNYTRTKPLPVEDLEPLRRLRKARFASIERQRGFLDSDEIGLKDMETGMVEIMHRNHPCLEVLEVNRGRVWVRLTTGGLVEVGRCE